MSPLSSTLARALAIVLEPMAHQWLSVGWRASRTAHAGFVLDALEQAVHDRRPAKGAGLVHHSDRGSQYCSVEYQAELRKRGVLISMSGKGDSYDCEYGIAA